MAGTEKIYYQIENCKLHYKTIRQLGVIFEKFKS